MHTNILMGTVLSGWWILQLHWRYVRSHVKGHHPSLGDPTKDGDTEQYIRLRLLDQLSASFLKRNLAELLVGAKTLVNLPYLLRERLLPDRSMVLSKGEMFEIIAFAVAWAAVIALLAGSGVLLPFILIWVVPYLTTFQAINHLIETLEHFPLIWTRADPIEWTRNRKGPWVERWLTGAHGEGWHRVHHLYPGLPFWNLDRAHAIMMNVPAYAAMEYETGGIFIRGTAGEPPIISSLIAELQSYQATRAASGEMRA